MNEQSSPLVGPLDLSTARINLLAGTGAWFFRAFCLVAFASVGMLAISQPLRAADYDLCNEYIGEAEAHYGIPSGILSAIAFVESAKAGAPWPWTLNIDGKPYYLDTRLEALAKMTNSKGVMNRQMAVGCMQIFVRYHGKVFATPEQMLDPRNNVHYGAWYLRQLYLEFGNWTVAVARYHAGATNYNAQRQYVCRVLHYQIRLGFGVLTDPVKKLCSGDYERYLGVAELNR